MATFTLKDILQNSAYDQGRLRAISTLDAIVVHSSATPAHMVDVGAATLHKWHLQRGFSAIGYHFVVQRGGLTTPQAGRPLTRVGAHTKGSNRRTIGICMVGGTTPTGDPQDNFTQAQYDTLAHLIELLRAEHGPLTLAGHRDMPKAATSCPSFDVALWASSLVPSAEPELSNVGTRNALSSARKTNVELQNEITRLNKCISAISDQVNGLKRR